MKYSILAVAVASALILGGCSSLGGKDKAALTPSEDTNVAVKDTRITTDFRDQGLILTYTMTGNLEKIEVYGVAPAWAGNYAIQAELDAKEKLLKFVHGESMSSDTKKQLLAKTLDKARDNTVNRFQNNNDLTFDARLLEREFELTQAAPTATAPAESTPSNTSQRIAHRIESAITQKVVSLSSSGRLTGLHKTEDGSSKNGKFYWAKYEWSDRSQATSQMMRLKMK